MPVEMQGLVMNARGPDKGFRTGKQKVSVALTLPDGDIVVIDDEPKAEIEQWIVRGMTVPVAVDGPNPTRGEVLMDRIAPLSQRMTSRDWALCRLENVRALIALNVFDRAQMNLNVAPQEAAANRELAQWLLLSAVQIKLAARAAEPVAGPDGRLRGTADLISNEAKPSSRSGSAGSPDTAGWKGKRLYRAWLYGHDPYPVMDEAKFKPSRGGHQASLEGGDVPISVNPTDPTDVEFLWDEHDYDPKARPEPLSNLEAQDQMTHFRLASANPMYRVFCSISRPIRHQLATQLRASGRQVPDEWL